MELEKVILKKEDHPGAGEIYHNKEDYPGVGEVYPNKRGPPCCWRKLP
jgi:hypothetical protein